MDSIDCIQSYLHQLHFANFFFLFSYFVNFSLFWCLFLSLPLQLRLPTQHRNDDCTQCCNNVFFQYFVTFFSCVFLISSFVFISVLFTCYVELFVLLLFLLRLLPDLFWCEVFGAFDVSCLLQLLFNMFLRK